MKQKGIFTLKSLTAERSNYKNQKELKLYKETVLVLEHWLKKCIHVQMFAKDFKIFSSSGSRRYLGRCGCHTQRSGSSA